tara:strand:- start:443 stop:730 length:288 start_codon:yes stop_codon:yes gene_type:complete
MPELTISDYKLILEYYNINYKILTNSQIKRKGEKILAEKLCRCINNIKTKINKEKICNYSVFIKKGIANYGFTCKGKPKLKNKKGTRKKLIKLKK